ncbi:hypothetical protein HZH66_003845 [Vespula vulgaris]|uniref:Uncharacterized protein n=1 Tax=Vespula vulgaris TaxID=7454 RepID=A0A834KHM0_VESVU|nr:hypothetical protein HZH66_003845 [Vespula vulgaris]
MRARLKYQLKHHPGSEFTRSHAKNNGSFGTRKCKRMRIIRPETSELDSGLCVATTKSTQISLTLPLLLERTSRYAMQIAILRCTGL